MEGFDEDSKYQILNAIQSTQEFNFNTLLERVSGFIDQEGICTEGFSSE